MSDYHEPANELSKEVRDMHRALRVLIEELEAIDWYNQRIVLCNDKELAEIIGHHRNEEIEHAAMNLEWIRRKEPKFHEELKTYLFTEKNILEVEEE